MYFVYTSPQQTKFQTLRYADNYLAMIRRKHMSFWNGVLFVFHLLYYDRMSGYMYGQERGNTFNENMCTDSGFVHKAYQDARATEQNMLLARHTTQLSRVYMQYNSRPKQCVFLLPQKMHFERSACFPLGHTGKYPCVRLSEPVKQKPRCDLLNCY